MPFFLCHERFNNFSLCSTFSRLKIMMISSQPRKVGCIFRTKEATTSCMIRRLQPLSKCIFLLHQRMMTHDLFQIFLLLKKSVSNATNDKQSLHKVICFFFLWTFNGLIFYYRELETELLLVATHFLQKDKDLRLPKNSKVSDIF